MATTASKQSAVTSAVSSSNRITSTSPSSVQSHHATGQSNNGGGATTSAFSEAAAADDIETIAQQISDHAEAIYQTWKARGLAPTEILNCHTGGGGCETFNKALTPTPNVTTTAINHYSVLQQPHRRSKPLPSASSSSSSPGDHHPFPYIGNQSSSNSINTNAPATAIGSNSSSSADMSSSLPSSGATTSSHNNNLEKLVSSFVNEDKARQQQQQAARRTTTTSILTSGTIRDALRKFEQGGGTANVPPRLVRPNYVLSRNSPPGQRMPPSSGSGTLTASTAASTSVNHLPKRGVVAATSKTTTSTSLNASLAATTTTSTASSPSPSTTTATATTTATTLTTKLNKHVPDVLMNTIEQSASAVASSKESSPPPLTSASAYRQKPETPAKPASLINHQPTWPLKGRSPHPPATSIGSVNGDNNAHNGSTTATANSPTASTPTIKPVVVNSKVLRPVSARKAAAELLDEVLLEEERLINALKTGTVLSSISSSSGLGASTVSSKSKLPEVITSTMQPDCSERVWPPQDMSVLTPTSVAAAIAAVPKTNGKSQHDEPDSVIRVAISNGGGSAKKSGGTIGVTSANDMMPASALAAMKITKSPRPRNDAAVPHPEHSVIAGKLSGLGGSSAKGGGCTSTVRPFLARGSVAERVLMFEKCPDHQPPRREPTKFALMKQESRRFDAWSRNWSGAEDTELKVEEVEVSIEESEEAKPATPATEHTTLQRRIRSSKNVYIPKFYYPHGKPTLTVASDRTLQRILTALDAFPNRQPDRESFGEVVEACGYPRYWRMPLFSCVQLTPGGPADGKRFIDFWKDMNVHCHDDTSRFIYIMARGDRTRPYIQSEDLITLVQDVVDTHPGLAFLKEAAEFHSRYVHTVIARIFYTVNRSWTGRITVPELRRSNLLQVLALLEDEEDINQIMAFFSYEHFYVIYCKFWELDRDHDLYIDQNDLARHNDHALSTRIIERIFSGCVTKGNKTRQGSQAGKMSYTEFVWFLLSEEDKTHPTSVEYWFRCMDLDGDGVLSMYELEYFYEEQQHRMESIGIETLPFEDCLCQMLDMVKPKRIGYVTLGDLKRCKTTAIFFDTFFNLEKYMEHEQRDPFATQRDQDEMTDWDRFAAQEYELLVAEEGGDTQGSYDEEDDYESNIDILESQLDDCMTTMTNEW